MTALLVLMLCGAAGAFFLGRRLSAGPRAALCGAAGFILQGAVIGRLPDRASIASAALLPWIFLLADRTLASSRRAGLPSAAGLALLLVVMFLSGMTAEAWHVSVLTALYALLKRPRLPGGLLLTMTALAIVALMPFWSSPVPRSTEPASDLPGALLPYVRGGSAAIPGFIGVLLPLLALFALVRLPRRRTFPFAVIAVVTVLLAARSSLDPAGPAGPPLALYGLSAAMLATMGVEELPSRAALPAAFLVTIELGLAVIFL